MEVKDWSEAIGRPVKMRNGEICFIAGDASKLNGMKSILSPIIGFSFDGKRILPHSWDKNGENRPDQKSIFDLIEYANEEEIQWFKQNVLDHSLNFCMWYKVPVTWEGAPFDSQKLILKTERGTYIAQGESNIAEIDPNTIKGLKLLWELEKPKHFSIKNAISGKILKAGNGRLGLIVEDMSKFPILLSIPRPLIGGTFNPNGDLCIDIWMADGKKDPEGFDSCNFNGYANSEDSKHIIKVMSNTALQVAYEMEAFVTWDGEDEIHKIIGKNRRGDYIFEKEGKVSFVNPKNTTGAQIVKWR